MTENILEVKHFSKIYNVKKEQRGVFDISFKVKKGDFHAFIGENGAGKTTTIKSIVGAYYSYKGQILLNGIDNRHAKSKQIIGYVPEITIFPKEITTFNYLKYLALLNGVEPETIKDKINEMLKLFNIENLKNEKPYDFSSGQKKKVLLIQALIHDPELIILDEPAANLDPTARYELFNLLNELQKKGKTIFISSHVLSEIDKHVNSLTLIHNGQILYSGPKTDNLEKIYYEKVIQK